MATLTLESPEGRANKICMYYVRKSQRQVFLSVSGSYISAPQMASPYKTLILRKTFCQILSHMKYCTDLILVLNGLHLYSSWHDSQCTSKKWLRIVNTSDEGFWLCN